MNPFEKPSQPQEQAPHKFEMEDDDRYPFVGGEPITPTAVLPDERLPDGNIDTRPAKERGWLAALTRAFARKELSKEERRKNVQEIADAAKDAGVSKDKIKEQLEELGITVIRKEEK